MGIIKNYQEKSFKEVYTYLYHQFFIYNIILIGFTIMTISFFKKFQNPFINTYNIIITCLILGPLIYLVLKSIYGLILLNEGYKPYHYVLVNEYCLLFLIGYHIIVLSVSHYNFVYCIESFIIVFFICFLKRLPSFNVFLSGIIVFMFLYFLSSYYYYHKLLVMLTFVYTIFICTPLLFISNKDNKKEMTIIEEGYKKCPHRILKDFIN